MRLILGFVVAIFLAGCAVQVKTLQDSNVDFSNYETFCWLEGCKFSITGPSYINDSLLQEKLKTAITEELLEKGLRQDKNNPDLLIDFHILMQHETITIYHENIESDGFEFYSEKDTEYLDFLKGTLVIDIVDKSKSKMVWRSAAVRYMDINPELTLKNIKKGIVQALKDYPPKMDK